MATRGRGAALSLYRAILRAHKDNLPAEMRSLGDAYVKSEFKLHKTVEKTVQLDAFFTAWEEYLNQVQQTARIKESSLSLGEKEITASFGQHLSPDIELSEEQEMQLEKLKEEASKAGR
ncbi:unnamed protein product [Cylindrotheca closterium]|uniref:Succinate dehydrogenase assembly factor 3 n=1 Tax=Cylindrotheca closterium TaxID=2856 RepID=A0AAD2FTS0_9STRA|nr:unnamed protein product [Cylindrotheca closterium]